MINNQLPPLSSPPPPSPRHSRATRLVTVFVVLALLLGGVFWYGVKNKSQPLAPSPQRTLALSYTQRSKQIADKVLNRLFVYGFVTKIQADGFVFVVHGVPLSESELFAAITPSTKFYQKKNASEGERKVKISRTDIKVGDPIMAVASDIIGSRTNFDALEIIKFQ